MYCHVSMIQAVVSLNDTLNPDFGTWIEQKTTILKKLFFFPLVFFLFSLNAWNGFINPICCFFLNTLELFVCVI